MAKLAQLIGVSEYEPGLETLPSAVKDVEALQQILAHPEMGGFDAADITVLQNPDRQTMADAIYFKRTQDLRLLREGMCLAFPGSQPLAENLNLEALSPITNWRQSLEHSMTRQSLITRGKLWRHTLITYLRRRRSGFTVGQVMVFQKQLVSAIALV